MKILCFTPLPYGDGSGWWGRDLALTVRGFRELGHDAWLSCWAPPSYVDPLGRPFLPLSPQEAESPAWWQKQKPDAVLLGLWTMPRYDQIRKAALSATPHVIERCDSDGIRVPSLDPLAFFRNQLAAAWDRARPGYKIFRGLGTLAKLLVYQAGSPVMEARLAKTFRQIPYFLVETPIATARFQSLAKKVGINPLKFCHVPHPIDTSVFRAPTQPTIRRPVVVSVGRWESTQKNWPLLERSLEIFLDENPDYSSVIFGPDAPSKKLHRRIVISGQVSQINIANCFNSSQVLFFSSRYEGCLLAGAEALCCGCSVVGPSQVACSDYFSSFFNGSLNNSSRACDLARVLSFEAEQWRLGKRDPLAIASQATAAFSYREVALRILSIFTKSFAQP